MERQESSPAGRPRPQQNIEILQNLKTTRYESLNEKDQLSFIADHFLLSPSERAEVYKSQQKLGQEKMDKDNLTDVLGLNDQEVKKTIEEVFDDPIDFDP